MVGIVVSECPVWCICPSHCHQCFRSVTGRKVERDWMFVRQTSQLIMHSKQQRSLVGLTTAVTYYEVRIDVSFQVVDSGDGFIVV